MTRHMLIALAVHDDGSQSSRVWPLTADRVDQAVTHLGEPGWTTHVHAAAELAATVHAASIVIGQEN